ncbi:radical SAM protein [Nannocystis sp. SCPEA4]|uniref:radical SAM protein n=1 Tax=Nannocystis sp. SCPEA4 TaxID=2996787 RepID=UPI00226E095B|nr:radical SAM protein [Nannocystis sp. SCPEA4]MCY1054479.1 radical SAM protein [Nannocystis sp. SCPEA4]
MDSVISGATVYHVVTLSNFARGFDKYQRRYRKSLIPESTYPDVVHVLAADELAIGVRKARGLLARLALPGDALVALEARLPAAQLRVNERNGLGRVWPSGDLPVRRIFAIDGDGQLGAAITVEDATARALALHAARFTAYEDLVPRSISFLPVAKGCQAACAFCFSDASVSAEQTSGRVDLELATQWLRAARRRGAGRAVITGGGEPTLLAQGRLLALITACREQFAKVVLITNGVRLAGESLAERRAWIADLAAAGLGVLAVSRHHWDEAVNAARMNLATHTERVLEVAANSSLRTRLICVLQRGGVESVADIDAYVQWAAARGVREVCFKELYVSTSHESVYHSLTANQYSAEHQVPLARVHEWARGREFAECERLPWGAPVYAGTIAGSAVRVAAYTEPSLFWERTHGLARSWNVMSDHTCLASLEDRASAITLAQIDRGAA